MVAVIAAATLILAFGLKSLASEAPLAGTPVAAPEPVAELPVVTVSRLGDRLQASSTAEAAEWHYLGPLTQPACDSALFTVNQQDIRSGREIRLQETDTGRYYCFRALLGEGLSIYASYQAEQASLKLMIEQDLDATGQRVLRLVASRPPTSRQALGPLVPPASCAQALFEDGQRQPFEAEAVVVGDVEALLEAPAAGNYCFRGRVAGEAWVYVGRRPSAPAAPAWSWRQADDGRLPPELGDFPGSGLEYVVQSAGSATCSMEDFSDRRRVQQGAVDQSAGVRYCFRIKDDGGTYHYAAYPAVDD